jgi:hypothetical protein
MTGRQLINRLLHAGDLDREIVIGINTDAGDAHEVLDMTPQFIEIDKDRLRLMVHETLVDVAESVVKR